MDYNLQERCVLFSENLITFLKGVERNEITRPIIRQLIRSGTSIGVNYAEANQAVSRKDFRNKACISRKEAGETKYWLRLLSKASPQNTETCRQLYKETHELVLIFSKIVQNTAV